MKDMFQNPVIRALIASVGWLSCGICLAAEDTSAGRMIIGLAQPPNSGLSGADLPEPLRQALTGDLQQSGIDVVPLASGTQSQIDEEARSRNCQYVLYARQQQKHGIGSMFSKLAPLAGVLPFAGLKGGGGMAGVATQAVANQAASTAASQATASMAQAATGQSAGSAQTTLHRGDALTLEYRLIPTGSTVPIKSDTLSVKADVEGQDLLTPLGGQLANSVRLATHPASGIGSGTPTASTITPRAAATAPGPGAPDCARIASMPNPPISLEACQKMATANQAYTQALSDPRAARPGDEQMSCEQIAAELRQQQISPPDRAQTARFQKAVTDEQSLLQRHMAEQMKTHAEVQAAVDAGAAIDKAAEISTLGLAHPNTAAAAAEAGQARARIEGERQARERRPTEQKMMGGVADIAQSAADQVSANPRLARLMQLASTAHCKQF